MKKSVIVLCVGNACRSQMAEGYLHYYTRGQVDIFSAGFRADGLHPLAVEVMKEDGLDIRNQFSKRLEDLTQAHFDYAITVCDHARQILPSFPDDTLACHFHFEDPSRVQGPRAVQLEAFRQVREQIKKYVLKFVGRELIEEVQSAA